MIGILDADVGGSERGWHETRFGHVLSGSPVIQQLGGGGLLWFEELSPMMMMLGQILINDVGCGEKGRIPAI